MRALRRASSSRRGRQVLSCTGLECVGPEVDAAEGTRPVELPPPSPRGHGGVEAGTTRQNRGRSPPKSTKSKTGRSPPKSKKKNSVSTAASVDEGGSAPSAERARNLARGASATSDLDAELAV